MAWYSNPDLWQSVASIIPALMGGGGQPSQPAQPGQLPVSQASQPAGQANPYSMIPARQEPAQAPVVPTVDQLTSVQDIMNNLPPEAKSARVDRASEITQAAKESANKQQETEQSEAAKDAKKKETEQKSGTSLKQAMMSPEVIAALAQLAMGPNRQASPASTMALPTSSFRAPVNPYTGR